MQSIDTSLDQIDHDDALKYAANKCGRVSWSDFVISFIARRVRHVASCRTRDFPYRKYFSASHIRERGMNKVRINIYAAESHAATSSYVFGKQIRSPSPTIRNSDWNAQKSFAAVRLLFFRSFFQLRTYRNKQPDVIKLLIIRGIKFVRVKFAFSFFFAEYVFRQTVYFFKC